jgi:hypothetical protein
MLYWIRTAGGGILACGIHCGKSSSLHISGYFKLLAFFPTNSCPHHASELLFGFEQGICSYYFEVLPNVTLMPMSTVTVKHDS